MHYNTIQDSDQRHQNHGCMRLAARTVPRARAGRAGRACGEAPANKKTTGSATFDLWACCRAACAVQSNSTGEIVVKIDPGFKPTAVTLRYPNYLNYLNYLNHPKARASTKALMAVTPIPFASPRVPRAQRGRACGKADGSKKTSHPVVMLPGPLRTGVETKPFNTNRMAASLDAAPLCHTHQFLPGRGCGDARRTEAAWAPLTSIERKRLGRH